MKEYQAPEISLFRFTAEEILTSSGSHSETGIIKRTSSSNDLHRVDTGL